MELSDSDSCGTKKAVVEKSSIEGVRISFEVDGLVENIIKTFEWIKKQINETISYLNLSHINPKQIISLFPTIYVDIHKKYPPEWNEAATVFYKVQ